MTGLLEEWSDSLEVVSFEQVTTGGDSLYLTNLLARYRPGASRRVLFLTHWDTRPRADQSPDPGRRGDPVPGANDGASGTAVLLHLAELLSASPAPAGVDLLFVDGEDYGPGADDMLFGSRHFARSIEGGGPWTYALLLDMVGDRDPSFPVEAYSAERASQVVQRVWSVAADLGYGSFFPLRVGPRVLDDHLPLNDAGVPTVDLIDFEYGPGNRFWHTTQDDLTNVSSATLEMVGEVVAELAYRGG
jgi:Zn-dependent M28 family amino/carboxypeptidase